MRALEPIKYILLFLLLCNIPAYSLVYFGPGSGATTSVLSSLLLIIYFALAKPKHKPPLPFIIFGLMFFCFSSFNYSEVDTTNFFIKEFSRFMIVAFCSATLLYHSKTSDFFFILLIGALSIICNAILFPEANAEHNLVIGRFSGFFLNPNYAGSACLIGFALSYRINSRYIMLAGQFLFTFAGILTLSRTFVIVWLLINLIAIYKSRKNLMAPLIGVGVLLVVFTMTDTKIFASNRFSALESFFGDGPVETETLKEDSRTDTWAMYYDMITDKPLFGHGFMKLQKHTSELPGVHNTYLLVIGEGGIVPFLILIGIYFYLLIKSYNHFGSHPELLYIILIVMLSMTTGHTYFFIYNNILFSIYVFIMIKKLKAMPSLISD
ncbi:O-antigen ligase family protein [Zobellia alginiliquefaciens]|uniref:O-antigen ligase family protein n=1 Tax=Zobellia alginiliquefaciens TaxID=3032586 RepID=UPI0023E4437C|nr:O-antigen ligase family protein [Zobellia alginiliquefaciens]